MNINSLTSSLSSTSYQASGQAGNAPTNAQNAITSSAEALASGKTESTTDYGGYSTDTVGKLLNILV